MKWAVKVYSIISGMIFKEVLNLAAQYKLKWLSVTFNTEKYFLINQECVWFEKKRNDNKNSFFDITIKGKHVAKVFEVHDGFLFTKKLKDMLPENVIGLCSDDGIIDMNIKNLQERNKKVYNEVRNAW